MSIRKKKYLTVAAFLILSILGATFAYWTQELTVHNRFSTGEFMTKINEVFRSTDNWVPGVEVEKKVSIENIGTVDAVVRVSFTEVWQRAEDILDYDGSVIMPSGQKGYILNNTFEDENGMQDAAIKNFAPGLVIEYNDGMDLLEQSGKWVAYQGYYYYMGTLKAQQETPLLLESVTMHPKLDNLLAAVHKTIGLDEHGNVSESFVSVYGKYGYDSCNYTLTVNGDTLQASAPAITEHWEDNPVTAHIIEHYSSILD